MSLRDQIQELKEELAPDIIPLIIFAHKYENGSWQSTFDKRFYGTKKEMKLDCIKKHRKRMGYKKGQDFPVIVLRQAAKDERAMAAKEEMKARINEGKLSATGADDIPQTVAVEQDDGSIKNVVQFKKGSRKAQR